ncbi:MAG: hypothetical protein ACD_30C00112G0058 [uncultured bacterium]|uniref:ATP synthase subunit a n=4 Tax=Candidatus Daviesiibacteriota TaxID=1752718 RepID=A0A0G0I337_9BACT|nr:MAG: hypothetical protein ACD_30C00112G0058 [uncultured bacterium]KKQ10521.1 MAG: ATP synthase subunit a [Candidatus Daviesbacteria bacterium GW2011_GWB1_36_5]KKQ14945.1 MAG: ATP synthase subunit a [Candidatus Daviesbacteria bacterium GW2011_GWA1_36_8]OGE17218.1 MAG: ATP synthase F0 subunit A [Candidatus Daviesbacteria bacterium RIFCSPHIGHO2_01_FULL_36_37]OGE35998.1 MAG: ATP synthase F0 subunit A [Candidatus Daviesbacteria bacterium RIFCSPHIGHO2_12_FULL_37_16]
MEHEIVLKPEVLGYLGVLPVTNTLLVAWITMAILIILALFIKFRMKTIPGKFQNLIEIVIDTGYKTVEEMAHNKTKLFFPIVMTFFLYILISNWFGLFPGFATIGFYEQGEHGQTFVPLLRSINSDLNMTLGLALLSVAITHIFAIKFLGLKGYLKKWFSLEMFGVFLFVGLLELVGEFTKIVSLSFRLFGNIFAGEVVLATISNIFAFIVPLPFYFLELIVGFVQAAVFMMLTLVFMVLLSEKHGDEH